MRAGRGGKGWRATSQLDIGDQLRSHEGQWVAVEDLLDTGEEEVVYNLRIAEYHTYFVGEEAWGFSVWAHNRCNLNFNSAIGAFGVYTISIGGKLYKIGKADFGRITQSTGLPTRIHQQVRELRGIYGNDAITFKRLPLGTTTTQLARGVENALLQAIYDLFGFVPDGNIRSFIPQI